MSRGSVIILCLILAAGLLSSAGCTTLQEPAGEGEDGIVGIFGDYAMEIELGHALVPALGGVVN